MLKLLSLFCPLSIFRGLFDLPEYNVRLNLRRRRRDSPLVQRRRFQTPSHVQSSTSINFTTASQDELSGRITRHRAIYTRRSSAHRSPLYLHSVTHGRIPIESSISPSIVASILYRASPLDPALKPASIAHQSSDTSRFEPPSVETSASVPSTGTDTTKAFSPTLPDPSSIGRSFSAENKDSFPGSISAGSSLPALAALASVASAPTSNLRYVQANEAPTSRLRFETGREIGFPGLPCPFCYNSTPNNRNERD